MNLNERNNGITDTYSFLFYFSIITISNDSIIYFEKVKQAFSTIKKTGEGIILMKEIFHGLTMLVIADLIEIIHVAN